MVGAVGCLELVARLVASPNSDKSSKLSQQLAQSLPYTVEMRRQRPISIRDILHSLPIHLKLTSTSSGSSNLPNNEGLKLTKFV
jgi:hypothetical protein